MDLVTFDLDKDEADNHCYWNIPEENKDEFITYGTKLIMELRWKLRTPCLDILAGKALNEMYAKKLFGIQPITEEEAKERKAKLWVGLPTEFIFACFNKNKPIKTTNGWLFT